MSTPSEDAVQRFRRRMQGTDEATLYRNLEAGVYGQPGSPRRAVAERALHAQFSEAAQALQTVRSEEAERAAANLAEIRRLVVRATWIAAGAALLALIALLRTFGQAGP